MPRSATSSEIQSSGKRATDRFTVALNARYMPRRMLGMVMYQLTSARNFADSATMLPSDSTNPDADWGPSAQDVRHRIFFNVNTPLARGVRMGLNVQGASAMPYNIITGFDTNGDSVFNDRDAGVTRNSARGATQWTANMRLNKSIGLGGVRSGPPNMPLPPPPPPPGGAMAQRVGGGGPGGGDGPQMVVMEGGNTAIPAGPVPQRAERVQQDQLQRLRRQPAVVVLRHRHVGRSGAPDRNRGLSQLLRHFLPRDNASSPYASEGSFYSAICWSR